jgi:hypothetical protein
LFAKAGSNTIREASSHYDEKRHDGTVNDEVQEGLKQAVEGLRNHFGGHITRKLQELPPAFVPTRACGESFTVTTKEEIQAAGDVFITALFPPGSPQETLTDLAKETLFGQVKYDMKVAKVCMTCVEAAAILEDDAVNNLVDQYGFLNYCANGLYGADAVR